MNSNSKGGIAIKKVEIIARTTEENGAIAENLLLVLEDQTQVSDHFLTSSVLSYPGLEIRLHQRRVLRDGQDVNLSKYEYGVLVYLAQHPGWLCSKEQIFQQNSSENRARQGPSNLHTNCIQSRVYFCSQTFMKNSHGKMP